MSFLLLLICTHAVACVNNEREQHSHIDVTFFAFCNLSFAVWQTRWSCGCIWSDGSRHACELHKMHETILNNRSNNHVIRWRRKQKIFLRQMFINLPLPYHPFVQSLLHNSLHIIYVHVYYEYTVIALLVALAVSWFTILTDYDNEHITLLYFHSINVGLFVVVFFC